MHAHLAVRYERTDAMTLEHANKDVFGAVLERAACTLGTSWQLWVVLLAFSIVAFVVSHLFVTYLAHLIRFVHATVYYLSLLGIVGCAICLATTVWIAQQEGLGPSCASSQQSPQQVGSIEALVTAFLWQRFSAQHLSTLDIPDCIRQYME